MLRNIVQSFVFVLSLTQVVLSSQPLVDTSLGTIRGHHLKSYNGRTFSAFEGVPFAKRPLGKLRFKEPQDPEPWTGIWDAKVKHECIQISLFTSEPAGTEDCLYLNIYVPKEEPSSEDNLNVIVFFHPGGFMAGTPDIGGPEYLMDRDVIYVNVNYRLSVLGFLSTEDNVVPGNNGLKDQVAALRWVQRHIKSFGGNPESVTITGSSAGGSSVHFHYLSPLSKGLFHRGISHSGVATNNWAFQEAPLEHAKKLAASVGCPTTSTKELVDCLKHRPARQLIENVKDLEGAFKFPLAPFAPAVEKTSGSGKPFFPAHPYKLLKAGKINHLPWLSAAAEEEGTVFGIAFVPALDVLEEKWNEVLHDVLDYNYTVTTQNKNHVAESIKKYYFKENKLSIDNIRTLIKLLGDRNFLVEVERCSKLQAKVSKSPVYTYIYGYQGEYSFTNSFGSDIRGAGHLDDSFLIYAPSERAVRLFGGKGQSPTAKLSQADEEMKETLLDIVTSFAKTGVPTVNGVNWKPLKKNSDVFGYYLVEGPSKIERSTKKDLAPIEFWNSLPILECENLVDVKDEL